jgi:hypothetical protein
MTKVMAVLPEIEKKGSVRIKSGDFPSFERLSKHVQI